MILHRTQLRLQLPHDEVVALCRRFGVTELAVFGSALREDFRPDSDIDFLVVFDSDDLGPWMSRLSDFQAELSALLQRPVDVALKSSVERSENYIRRNHILRSAQRVYVA
jgi:predicted nucleotidyltransferase